MSDERMSDEQMREFPALAANTRCIFCSSIPQNYNFKCFVTVFFEFKFCLWLFSFCVYRISIGSVVSGTPGLGKCSFQKNATFLRSFAFFSKVKTLSYSFAFFIKRTLHSLRSFTFFIKERCILCVLLRSL